MTGTAKSQLKLKSDTGSDIMLKNSTTNRKDRTMKMHAGEMLKMQLEERMPDKDIKHFSEHIGIKESDLLAIFNGEKSISTRLSKKISDVFEMEDPAFWSRVQKTCNERNAKIDARAKKALIEQSKKKRSTYRPMQESGITAVA